MPDSSQSPDSTTCNARNTGTGTQPINQGPGAQQVLAGSHGKQYNLSAGGNLHLILSSDDDKKAPKEVSREDIIDWLRSQSALDSVGRHRWLLSQRVGDTGSWVLNTPEFLQWRDGSSRLLWMQGILGCGKSTLASIIVDSLEKDPPDEANTACVYVYFSHSEEQQQVSFADIFISLTLQLMQHQGDDEAKIDDLVKMYNKRRYGKIFHICDDYLDLFKTQAAAFDKVFLIFDALDTCEDSADERTQQLLQKAIVKQLPPNIKILATSRSSPPSLWKRHDREELVIKADPEDLATYIRDRIETHGHMQSLINEHPDADFKLTVIEKVIQTTSEMFLLAKLHMDKLSEQWTLGDFKSALDQLHTSISQAFEDSVQTVQSLRSDPQPKKYELAQHILTWVIHAATPMTIENVRHSFALKYSPAGTLNLEFCPSESLALDYCAGLVVKDPQTGHLHLVHPSVREYIRNHGIIPQQHDNSIARTCLSYLLLNEFAVKMHTEDAVRARLSKYRLLEYATLNWATHLRRAEKASQKDKSSCEDLELDSLYKLALDFLKSTPQVTSSFQALQVVTSTFKSTTDINGLHVAAYYNILGLIDRLVAKDRQLVNSPCSDGQTALHWAVKKQDGRGDTVGLLLRHSADPNIQDNDGNTSLHEAVMVGQDANTTMPFTEREKIIKQLTKAGARPIVPNKYGVTPLKWATIQGPSSMATILVQSLKRTDIDTPDYMGWTPLWDALHSGQLEIAELLLKGGADPNQPSPDGRWTPLARAAQAGHQDTVHLLCRHGANINCTSPDEGHSPLRWAAAHRHTNIAQHLIQYGADIETKALDGSTPLISAAQNGDEAMVWALTQAGAKLDVQDDYGASALHYAAMSENKPIVWLLVVRGADLSLRDKQGLGVLDWAVQRGNFPIVWLLVESAGGGGNQLLTSTAPAPSNMNVLHRAANLGHEEIVRFLLARGAPHPDEKDGEDMTPLHYAVAQGREGVVRILASHGVQLDIPGNGGMTPLVLASSQRNLGIMRTLLDHGASPDVQDNIGWTSLHYAASLADVAFTEGLELLLERSRNPNARETDMGFTALHLAVRSGRAEMVVLFKRNTRQDSRMGAGQKSGQQGEGGVDVNVQDHEGRTALMLAAGQGNEVMTFHLARRQGARQDLKDKHGQTARDYARDHANTARWLDEV